MSFPWTNLITAGSTLIGALGGASFTALITNRIEGRRLAHERRMNRVSLRVDAYAEFLRYANANARMLALAVLRFCHGVPNDDEARKMIDEMSELVIAFQAAHARVEVVGSERAVETAQEVDQGARRVGALLRDSYLSGRPVDLDAGTSEHAELKRIISHFALLSRRELAEQD